MKSVRVFIRIEPDWNVKDIEVVYNDYDNYIRIEPDWNVKVRFASLRSVSLKD